MQCLPARGKALSREARSEGFGWLQSILSLDIIILHPTKVGDRRQGAELGGEERAWHSYAQEDMGMGRAQPITV